MAQRRMFSKDITENDAFLDMPLSTQALYFHLGMQADDDGFVSPNRISRMLGCQPDDLRILVAKKFVLQFEDGVVVIKHWKINNYLRNDRYKPTTHQEKMAQLTVKSNNGYRRSTNGIPMVDAGKVRLGKDSIYSENKFSHKNKNMYEEPTIQLDDSGEEVEVVNEIKVPRGFRQNVSRFYCEVFNVPVTKGVYFGHKRHVDGMIQLAKDLYGDDFVKIEKDIKERIKIAKKYADQNGWEKMKISTIEENWNSILSWEKKV